MSRISKVAVWAVVFNVLVGVCYSKPSAEDTSKTIKGPNVVITLTGPTTCSMKDEMTINVEVDAKIGGGGNVGTVYEITLMEKDKGFDDKVEKKTVEGPKKPGAWKKSVAFTFNPKKFEIGKTLEFYLIVKPKLQNIRTSKKLTNKKDPLKVKCK